MALVPHADKKRKSPDPVGAGSRPTNSSKRKFRTVAEARQALLAECDNVEETGANQWSCQCLHPGHEDNRNSLCVGESDDRLLIYCQAGCPTEEVLAAIGWTMGDLFVNDDAGFARDLKAHRAVKKVATGSPPTANGKPKKVMSSRPRSFRGSKIVATYDYHDELGRLIYQVCRTEDKQFPPLREVEGGWSWGLGEVRPVLYRQRELLAADPALPVFVVEGEKDADRLASLDESVVATTSLGGASKNSNKPKWQAAYSDSLAGRHVVIIPDNDESGHAHAEAIARMSHGKAASVRIVELPGLPPKGDVSDYLDAGGTLDSLLALVEAAKSWTPGDAPADASDDGREESLDVREPADSESLEVDWLWENRVPFGMVTLCDGNPGVGKSTLWLEIIARFSRGYRMPPGPASSIGGGSARHALILSAEDDLARIIRPRLEAAGADLARVSVVTTLTDLKGERRPITLPPDLPHLRRFIEERQTGLVVIDPIMAFIGDRIDTNTDQKVRRCLFPLAQMADETGVAVVAIRHLNKKAGGEAIYRGGGSIAFTAAARVALIVGTDPHDPDTKVLAVAKSNAGPLPSSLTYTIQPVNLESGISTSRVSWGGPCDLGANDIIDHQVKRQKKQDDAGELILAALANGPLAATELKQAMVIGHMVAERTFERSRAELCGKGLIESDHEKKLHAKVYWRLPGQPWPWEETPHSANSA